MSLCATFYKLCVLLVVAVSFSTCLDCPADRKKQDHDEVRLYNHLIYDIHPPNVQTKPVNVSIISATPLISFDNLEETFTAHSIFHMFWKDESLQWHPADYGNVDEIEVPNYYIWIPRMMWLNADASLHYTDVYSIMSSVRYDGTVTLSMINKFSGICGSSLRSWPYDVQNCTLYFETRMNIEEQVKYSFSIMKTNDHSGQSGWQLLNIIQELQGGAHETFKFTFVLKREAAGIAAIVVIPSVFIVLLTLVSMVLDVRNNTRLFFITFSLYINFILLTVVGNLIPQHNADTPVLLLFLRDSLILTIAGVTETLFLMNLKQRDTSPPGWIVILNRLVRSGPIKHVVLIEFDPSEVTESNALVDDVSDVHEAKARAQVDWIQFANLFNSVSFIAAVVTYFVLICAYIPRDK